MSTTFCTVLSGAFFLLKTMFHIDALQKLYEENWFCGKQKLKTILSLKMAFLVLTVRQH